MAKNHQISHEWFYQTKEKGSGSSYFYEGPIIYSYGRHFPIARIVEKNGEKIVLFTTSSYSGSTSAHVNMTRGAIPSYVQIIEMRNVPTEPLDRINHKPNIEAYTNELQSALKALETARKKEKWIGEITSLIDKFKAYMDFFQLPLSAEMETLFNDPTIEKFDTYMANEAARIAKDKKKEEQKRGRAVKKQVSEWQEGKRSRVTLLGWKYAYLRISKSGNRIETTEGIEIPVDKAYQLYQRIQQTLQNGGCTGDCGESFMEQYRIVKISKNTLHIGCHIIEMKEVNRIATLMNWTQQ